MAQRQSQTTAYRIEGGAYRVCDVPPQQRPREVMERLGARNVPEDILLAILIRSGVTGVSVIELARQLLRRYGSLTAMSAAPLDELTAMRGLGKVKAQVLKAAFELGSRMAEEQTPRGRSIRTPGDAAGVFRSRVRTLEEETFWVLLLDTKNQLKGAPVEITRGLLDASLIHPREAFREAIRSACAAVVFAHNHPSGDPTPSAEDVKATRQLVEAGRVVDIRVLDHIVLGRPAGREAVDFLSMREAGVVDFLDGGRT